MVCLGNICRSPLAEGILTAKVDPDQVMVDSAGTGGWHIGEGPDPRSVSTARKNGIDISMQRCRRFVQEDFQDFDQIYVMDRSNLQNVLKMTDSAQDRAKLKLILDELEPAAGLEVPDPYYGGDSGFDRVYEMLDEACDRIAEKLNHES